MMSRSTLVPRGYWASIAMLLVLSCSCAVGVLLQAINMNVPPLVQLQCF